MRPSWATISQSLLRLATVWTVRVSNPDGRDFSAPFLTGPASYTKGTGSFPGVRRPGRGVDHPPHLAPKLRKE